MICGIVEKFKWTQVRSAESTALEISGQIMSVSMSDSFI